jgi:tetraacyldisaccharide 4'-kinase
VLDDGFQHRRLARDLDIVMIDATRSPFEDRLLPRGWLREPVESIVRAGLVVLTHADGAATSTIEKQLRSINASLPILRGEHAWAGLLWRDAGAVDDSEVAASSLSGRRVMVCCAIGNPQRFVAMVQRAAGVPPCDVLTLRDHDAYEPATIAMLLDRARAAHADVIMVTDKDWSKLRRVRPEAWPCAVARPRLELNLSDDAAFDRALRESIERHRESMRSE